MLAGIDIQMSVVGKQIIYLGTKNITLDVRSLELEVKSGVFNFINLEEITEELNSKGIEYTEDAVKNLAVFNRMSFNNIVINGVSDCKRSVLFRELLNELCMRYNTKCLTLNTKIRDNNVTYNYYPNQLVQRVLEYDNSDPDKALLVVLSSTFDALFSRHASICILGAVPNYELNSPDSFYKQLARLSKLHQGGQKLIFAKKE